MNALEIKEIREDLGMTQAQFASVLEVNPRTVQKWEAGETKIRKGTAFLINDMKKRRVPNDGVKQKDHSAIPVDFSEMNVMYVPLINKFAYAGFLNGFGDDEYLDDLPRVPWANDFEAKGNYLCFEVKGDSMDNGSYESILEGDVLLCREVRRDYWSSKLHIQKWDFVIVHQTEGILVKRILDHDVEDGILVLHSLNEYYEDFKVNLNEVSKIFNIVDFRRKKSRR